MATVQTRLNRAMRLIGQIGSGESPTTDETADCLTALNAMLDSWRNDRLMCFAFQTLTLTLANGDDTYTIGTSGDVNTTRPVDILDAYIVDGNVSYPVKLIGEKEYASIIDKTTTADWPDVMLFRPTVASSLATVIVYPVPNAARTMKIVCRVPVTAFSAASDTVTLPPGWEEAIDSNLAIRIAPEFETRAPAEVVQMAKESLAGIKKTNATVQPRRLNTQLAAMFGPQAHSITTGE